MNDLSQSPGASRHKVRRFEDNAVTKGQCRRNFPGRNGYRKVPGRDDADDAKRLPGYVNFNSRAHRSEPITHLAHRFTTKFEYVSCKAASPIDSARTSPPHAQAVCLALPYEQGSRFLSHLAHRHALEYRYATIEEIPRSLPYCGRHLLRTCLSIFPDSFVGIGGIDIWHKSPAFDPLAVNQILELATQNAPGVPLKDDHAVTAERIADDNPPRQGSAR